MPSIVEFYAKSPEKKYNLFEVELETSFAKRVTQCDQCKSPIDTKISKKTKDQKPEYNESISATLESRPGSGESKQFDFCSEKCLSDFLKKRNK